MTKDNKKTHKNNKIRFRNKNYSKKNKKGGQPSTPNIIIPDARIVSSKDYKEFLKNLEPYKKIDIHQHLLHTQSLPTHQPSQQPQPSQLPSTPQLTDENSVKDTTTSTEMKGDENDVEKSPTLSNMPKDNNLIEPSTHMVDVNTKSPIDNNKSMQGETGETGETANELLTVMTNPDE
jgi:hypothetical protein